MSSNATGDAGEMLGFIRDLFPLCRSITGDGVRATLERMRQEIPLQVHEVDSGTAVFDWTVPDEWNISGAFIEGPDGQQIVDFAENNLHVVSYSVPVDKTIDLSELKQHLHSLPDQPDLIPYRTSYYSRDWGFCLSHDQLQALQPGAYRVRIDSTLSPGKLTLGELFIPGESTDEVLVYSHVCHPSLCNDNLSGLAITAWWAKRLMQEDSNRLSYRFVWGPGTIGSITWLARNEDGLDRIRHGLVTVLLGRPGRFTYKRSRAGHADVDRAAELVLSRRQLDYRAVDFGPYGYDERQFCSPGINLPVGRLTRQPNGEYPEYHTSADNLDLIDGPTLDESLQVCLEIGRMLDRNETFLNLSPKCEPQLGRRGLYRNTGGDSPASREEAMLWVLNLSDSQHNLIDIAQKSGLPVDVLHKVAAELQDAGLLKSVEDPRARSVT